MSEDPCLESILSEQKYGSTGKLSERTEALHAELNERGEVAISIYSTEVDFLQYIYSILLARNR